MSIKLPVIYKGKCYMPMRLSRAKTLEKLGRCKIKFDNKLKIKYVDLKYKPSGEERQEIVLGIDPGSRWDGFTLLTLKDHLINFQLNHNKDIKLCMKTRSTYRRTRRGRLRRRPVRFKSRTAPKLTATARSMFEFRKWLELKLKYFYPISSVVLEDIAFNHYKHKDGSTFSDGEIGKTIHEEFLKVTFPKLTIVAGFETYNARLKIFKGKDPKFKTKQKGANSFYTHCVDSYAMAHLGLDFSRIKKAIPKLKTFGISITKHQYIRRELYQVKAKLKNAKFHKKYLKGYKVVYYVPKGKVKVIYVQQKKYNYKDYDLLINGTRPLSVAHKHILLKQRDPKYKQFKKPYGGTVVNHVNKATVVLNKTTQKFEYLNTTAKIKAALKNIPNYKFMGYSKRTTKTFC